MVLLVVLVAEVVHNVDNALHNKYDVFAGHCSNVHIVEWCRAHARHASHMIY